MLVLAAPGLLVPMDGKPRDYIKDTPPEGAAGYAVPDTVYYTRRLLEGDLIMVTAPPEPVSLAGEVAEPAESAAAEPVAETKAVVSKKKGGA